MKNIKIHAQYIPYNDTYTATIQNGNESYVVHKQNAIELQSAVKRCANVEIEYNSLTRKFLIPEKNRF